VTRKSNKRSQQIDARTVTVAGYLMLVTSLLAQLIVAVPTDEIASEFVGFSPSEA
jgi:hypothetical protein